MTTYTYEAYIAAVQERATEVLGREMFNWREIEFNWADRNLAGDPINTAADALIIAALKQVDRAIRHNTKSKISVLCDHLQD